MATTIDYYGEKSRTLPRFLYRNFIDVLMSASSAEARAAAIANFIATLSEGANKGDFLKLKWVMPAKLRALLAPNEQAQIDAVLSQRRQRQSDKLSDVYPHCTDEFSLDREFIEAAFDATPLPLFDKATPIFTIGSCFARNISVHLESHGFDSQNFGQVEDLNSPYSNAAMLLAATAPEAVRDDYLTWWLEKILAGQSPEVIGNALANEQQRLRTLCKMVARSKLLIVTLGNTVDYHLSPDSDARIVGSVRVAPKFLGVGASEDVGARLGFAAIFKKCGAHLRLATYAETLTALKELHAALRSMNSTAPIVFTLSPVPIDSVMGIEKSGKIRAVETDCISKSTLRAAIAELLLPGTLDAACHYFPSYEIVRWIGAMLPMPNFGNEDAASRHVSADILNAIYEFFLRKHAASPARTDTPSSGEVKIAANMFLDAKRHTMERIATAPVRQAPFAHIYVENIFPETFYAEMQKHLLPDAFYKQLAQSGRVSPQYNPSRYSLFPGDLDAAGINPEARDFWKNLFATYCNVEFTQVWLKTFGPQIRDHVLSGDVARPTGDKIETAAEMFLMRDLVNYALPPHTDSPAKLVSALFYLPPDRSHPDLGTSFYTPKEFGFKHAGGPYLERSLFDLAGTAAYMPNTLLAFPKSSICFHGVEPVIDPEHRRDILLFDIKFAKRSL